MHSSWSDQTSSAAAGEIHFGSCNVCKQKKLDILDAKLDSITNGFENISTQRTRKREILLISTTATQKRQMWIITPALCQMIFFVQVQCRSVGYISPADGLGILAMSSATTLPGDIFSPVASKAPNTNRNSDYMGKFTGSKKWWWFGRPSNPI